MYRHGTQGSAASTIRASWNLQVIWLQIISENTKEMLHYIANDIWFGVSFRYQLAFTTEALGISTTQNCKEHCAELRQENMTSFQFIFTARIRRMGQGYIFSLCGSSHPPAGTAVRVLATRRAVCLLRSRRRTFLYRKSLHLISMIEKTQVRVNIKITRIHKCDWMAFKQIS